MSQRLNLVIMQLGTNGDIRHRLERRLRARRDDALRRFLPQSRDESQSQPKGQVVSC